MGFPYLLIGPKVAKTGHEIAFDLEMEREEEEGRKARRAGAEKTRRQIEDSARFYDEVNASLDRVIAEKKGFPSGGLTPLDDARPPGEQRRNDGSPLYRPVDDDGGDQIYADSGKRYMPGTMDTAPLLFDDGTK